MSRVDAAAASDRLPWLSDEPQQRPLPAKRSTGSPLAWAAGTVMVVVAGFGFWLGSKTAQEQPPEAVPASRPSTTVRLPEPRAAQTPQVRMTEQPELKQAPAPQVRPAPVHEVRIVPPSVRSAPKEETETPQASAEQTKAEAAAPPAPKAAAPAVAVRPSKVFVPPRPWNPRILQGAAGRVVQIGAFGSVTQAKHGWWHMVRSYPAMSHLPAVVRPSRNSRGRIFYRFQVGTTSQAHSEVLCQRMRRISFSCAVVDLPWKAKVER
jgi:hypothetical protein